MQVNGKDFRTVWMEGTVVKMIDQPLLPHRFEITDLVDYHATARAIQTMVVRGAPAIGASGAYGMAQAVCAASGDGWREVCHDASPSYHVSSSITPRSSLRSAWQKSACGSAA